MESSSLKYLVQLKEFELPGKVAHRKMISVEDERYFNIPKSHKKAAVLILCYPGIEGKLNIAYMERSSRYPADKHAGQISFPGGQLDESDESLEACAIREAHEELGIDPQKVSIIKTLSPLYVYVSQFLIQPYIGIIDERPDFKIEIQEVESLIETPLSYISDPNIIKRKSIKIREYLLPNVPYYDLYGHVLWGATAMITAEFLDLMAQIKKRPSQ